MKGFFEFKRLITPTIIKVIFILGIGIVLGFLKGALDIKADLNAIDLGA